MLVPFRGSIKDTLREMQEDLQSSISYAGGRDLNSIKLVDYVIVKDNIFDGDRQRILMVFVTVSLFFC